MTITQNDLGSNFLAFNLTTRKLETVVLVSINSSAKYEFMNPNDNSVFVTDKFGNSESFFVYLFDEELEDNFPNI